jgi:hypothetical protein
MAQPAPDPSRRRIHADQRHEGDSHVELSEGNFAAYEEDKEGCLGLDSVIPHRLKYKQFSR